MITRTEPPSGFQPALRLDAVTDTMDQKEMFQSFLARDLSPSEQAELPRLVHAVSGHTLLLKLTALQMEASHVSLNNAVDRFTTLGITGIGSEEVQVSSPLGTKTSDLRTVLADLFDASRLCASDRALLQTASLLPDLPLSFASFQKLMGIRDYTAVNRLIHGGWLNRTGDAVTMHPFLRESFRSRPFDAEAAEQVRVLLRTLTTHLGPLSRQIQEATAETQKAEQFARFVERILSEQTRWQEDSVFLTFSASLLLRMLPEESKELSKKSDALLNNPALRSAKLRLDLYDARITAYLAEERFSEAEQDLKISRNLIRPYNSPSLTGRFYDTLSAYFDERLGGHYDALTRDEKKLYRNFLKANGEAIRALAKSPDPDDRYLYIEALLSHVNRMARTERHGGATLRKLLEEAERKLKELRPHPAKLFGHLEMTRFWYYAYFQGEERAAFAHLKLAEGYYRNRMKTPMEEIRLLLIPKSDTLLYFGHVDASEAVLKKAIALCDTKGDCTVYLQCKLELLSYGLDCALERNDVSAAKRLLDTIDDFFPEYLEYDVVNPVQEELRLYIQSL